MEAGMAIGWKFRIAAALCIAAVAGVVSAAATCAVLSAPYVVAGAGPQVARAYLGAVDYYPVRSAEAYNGWYLLDRYDVAVRGQPAREAKADTRVASGPLPPGRWQLTLTLNSRNGAKATARRWITVR